MEEIKISDILISCEDNSKYCFVVGIKKKYYKCTENYKVNKKTLKSGFFHKIQFKKATLQDLERLNSI